MGEIDNNRLPEDVERFKNLMVDCEIKACCSVVSEKAIFFRKNVHTGLVAQMCN